MRVFLLLVGLFPAVGQGQTPPLEPEKTLATVTGDINGNGIPDKAVLYRGTPDDNAALAIFEDGQNATPAFVAPAIAWVGGIGQQPDLAISPAGSLQVLSMNEAIGRDRWHQTVTIAWRKGRYMLAGITYDWYDTLDPAAQGLCDVNLLSGKADLFLGENGPKRRIRVKLGAMPADQWDGSVPSECFPD